jgi:hypothetical protein
MSDVTLTTSIRDEAKSMSQEEFSNAYTKAQLELKASQAGVSDEKLNEAKTKADIVALIYGQYKFPDPALRGKSTIEEPVAAMWALLNNDLVKNGAEGRLRRKDGVAAGEAVGVAHYTARTQYQAWFEATDRGTKPLGEHSDPEGMPRGMARTLGLVKDEVVEEPAKEAPKKKAKK